MLRKCKNCKNEYEPINPRIQKFCKPSCRIEYFDKHRNPYIKIEEHHPLRWRCQKCRYEKEIDKFEEGIECPICKKPAD